MKAANIMLAIIVLIFMGCEMDKNNSINSLLIHNGWLEFDSLNDYKLYSEMLDDGSISKLIKLNYSKNKSE